MKNRFKFSGTITVQYNTPFSPFSADEYQDAVCWLASAGFDGAELCVSNYEGVCPEKIKKDLDANRLGCSTISTGQSMILEGISLLCDGSQLIQAQARLKEHIDAAVILGSKVTLGLLRGVGSKSGASNFGIKESKAKLAKSLEPVISYAAQKNVIIVLEAINRYETCLLNSAADTLSFIENDLGSPDCVGVLWDTFHANIEDADMRDAVLLLGKRLKHVHIADSNRYFPGYGHIDFESVRAALKYIDYDQYISFECNNMPLCDTVKKEAAAFIREWRNI
jgi:sugar phosphate isomerase/epimerase